MKRNIILGAAALAMATGCMQDLERSRGDLQTRESSRTPADGEALLFGAAGDGEMVGRIGPATVDQAPDHLNVYDDGWYTSVESVAVWPDRAAMLLVSMANGREIRHPGFAGTFRLEDFDAETQVTVLGCTGQEVDIYDEYDVPADVVDVAVEEGDDVDALRIEVTGQWGEGLELHTATSVFTLTP